jgi:NAD(P)H dehydrogenase (quinone)
MQRAITAAAEAGVGLIAYASFVNTGTSTLLLGQEHKQAEADLAGQYKVSVRVTCNALAMLAANRYVGPPGPSGHAASSGRRVRDARTAPPRR